MIGALICTMISASGAADWSPTAGPQGGVVVAFASPADYLFAGAKFGGVLRSDDAGATWQRVDLGLPKAPEVSAMAVVNQGVFVGTVRHGVYRSTDNGDSWSAMNTGIEDHLQVIQLFANGTDLLALLGDGSSTADGVLYISTDQGASWQAAGAAPTPFIQVVASGPMILGTSNAAVGLFRSFDLGETWDFVAAKGLNNASPDRFIVNRTTIFAANRGYPGIFKTTDNGDTWVQLDAGIPADARPRALGMSGSTLLAAVNGPGAAVYRFNDDSMSWQSADDGLAPGQGRIVHCLGAHGDQMLAGTDKGVFRSASLGDLWEEANDGLIAAAVNALAPNGQSLFATVAAPRTNIESLNPSSSTRALDTVFHSPDAGTTWSASHNGIPDGGSVRPLATTSSLVLAGSDRHGVFRSSDGGVTWVSSSNGLPQYPGGDGTMINYEIGHLAVSAAFDDAVIAAVQPRFSHPDHGSGIIQGGGMFRSTDGGLNWTPINNGIPLLGVNNPPFSFNYRPRVTGLGVVGAIAFIGTQRHGIFRSDNNGEQWSSASSGLPVNDLGDPPQITSFVALGSEIFASSMGFYIQAMTNNSNGVFRSSDGGLNWVQVGAGMAEGRPVNVLATDCAALYAGVGSLPDEAVAADAADGVYQSVDGGLTWSPTGSVLQGVSISSLTLTDVRLHAGTRGFGAWSAEVAADCNANGVADACDIASGLSVDADLDGVPDECQIPSPPGDVTADGHVNIDDLLTVIGAWGPCGLRSCPADIAPPPNGNGAVDVDDVLMVINNWE